MHMTTNSIAPWQDTQRRPHCFTLTLGAIVSARAACLDAFLVCVDERRPHSILYARLPCRSARDGSWAASARH